MYVCRMNGMSRCAKTTEAMIYERFTNTRALIHAHTQTIIFFKEAKNASLRSSVFTLFFNDAFLMK